MEGLGKTLSDAAVVSEHAANKRFMILSFSLHESLVGCLLSDCSCITQSLSQAFHQILLLLVFSFCMRLSLLLPFLTAVALAAEAVHVASGFVSCFAASSFASSCSGYYGRVEQDT